MDKENNNSIIDQNEEYENETRPLWVKIVGIIILISFLGFIFYGVLQLLSFPNISFLKSTSKSEKIENLKEAVVHVYSGEKKGTGFNLSKEGLVVTNHHVIENKDSVRVEFYNDNMYYSEKIISYPEIDIAIIYLKENDLKYVQIDKDYQVKNNEEVLTIGNPLDFSDIAHKATVIGKTNLKNWNNEVIMIDNPSIQKGSSGSPVFNSEGKVIGVIFAKLISDDERNIGLFVPVEDIINRIER